MRIEGKNYKTISAFKNMMTVPDCFVAYSNKIGKGHGEAKFYVASKPDMYDFYGGEKFVSTCFMFKTDLVDYMEAIKQEYKKPSQNYNEKNKMSALWEERMRKVKKLEEIIYFNVCSQDQIRGDRGYINSNDEGYNIIRELALPLVSYIYSELLEYNGKRLYYWKLLVDFEAIWEKQSAPLVLSYGKNKGEQSRKSKEKVKNAEINKARKGQGKYREKLLQQCRFCPITKVADERILIASHIKPWSVSNDREKIDPYNGYILSPLYDKLFDKGFITFTPERYMITSEAISNYNWKLLNIKNKTFVQGLLMDDKRIKYLEFHHKLVFKGNLKDRIDS